MYKKCNFCKWVKSDKDFYPSNKTKCRDCIKKAVKENRGKNIERYREYDRVRGNRQETGYLASYRNKNAKKYQATNMVNNAIRDKKLIKLCCEVCQTSEAVHGHHDDYDKPLEVRWLCAAHHHQWHAEHGEGKNGLAA